MKDHKTRFFEALEIAPGPWEEHSYTADGKCYIGSEKDIVCRTERWDNENSQLIATAPEMLWGLIDMVLFWQEQFCVEDCDIGAELNPCLDVVSTIESATGSTWAEVKRIYEETKQS